MNRQKNKNPVLSEAQILQNLQTSVFDHSDVFCAFGVGLATGVLIGLTYSCIILL